MGSLVWRLVDRKKNQRNIVQQITKIYLNVVYNYKRCALRPTGLNCIVILKVRRYIYTVLTDRKYIFNGEGVNVHVRVRCF